MVNIVGISGSLRSGSLKTALLKASSALVPSGVRLDSCLDQEHPPL